MAKFLDMVGLQYLWAQIKAKLNTKVEKEAGKGLSTHDFTKVEKDKLTGLTNYNHPNSGVAAGTYRSVTVNTQGHVTTGSNPTTLNGYGIIDAAAKVHTHGTGDITGLDAAKLTSGTISIDRLPQGALERCVVVTDDVARKALTTASIQKGDTVKVTATGLMYFVVDDTKLNVDAGYEVYTAGSATSVPWTGITGKPTSMPASDVSAWAKTATKPTYTPSEVGVVGTAPTTGQVAVFDGTAGKIKSNGYTIQTSVPSGAKFTDTTYTLATTTADGLFSKEEKVKLKNLDVETITNAEIDAIVAS